MIISTEKLTGVLCRLLKISLLVPLLGFSMSHADTVTTSITVDSHFPAGVFDLQPVEGLDQFDPALGILESVTFTVENDGYFADYFIFDALVIDETDGHFIDAFGQFQISLSLDLGSSGLLFASEANSAMLFCDGPPFDSPCTEFVSAEVSGAYLESEDATTRLLDEGVLGDFIGTGEVQNLEYGAFSFGPPDVIDSDNLDLSLIEGEFFDLFIDDTVISIVYGFAPSTVPAPAALWLVVLVVAGFTAKLRFISSTQKWCLSIPG